MLDRGNTRSDRCERHRKAHKKAIQAIAVPYVALQVIGEVLDPKHPTGPLGGLGPLPVMHNRASVSVDLGRFEFGMSDADIVCLLDGLRTHQVAVVEAGTGTGKSTFMPFRLMNPPDGAISLSKFGPIVVTEPRLAAAKGVARFVGEELCLGHDSRTCSSHIGPGFSVGYQVKGEKVWDSACELIYVTDGTMINWLRDGQLARIGAVIVDEAHERSENIDIILAQLRDRIHQYKHLRVIITSATLDKNFFVEYFGGGERVFHLSVPATKLFGYGVPLFPDLTISDELIERGVTISGQGECVCEFAGWAPRGPEQDGYAAEDLYETTRHLATLRCIDPIPTSEWKDKMPAAVAMQIAAIARGTEWGDILAFLPTSASIQTAVAEISARLKQDGILSVFDVYPLLSTTDKSTIDKATGARQRGDKRKIVVSSNLAETSLTVKGVRYVVDSGLICQPEWDPDIASGSYPTKPHSQSGVRQRWGRVGRDSPGWVFPLYSTEQFLALALNTPPGSAQANLEGFFLKLVAAGLNIDGAILPTSFRHDAVVYDSEALKTVDTFENEYRRARNALRLAGAIDSDGHLTDYGHEIERFPGDASEALAFMLAEQLACVHDLTEDGRVVLVIEPLASGVRDAYGNIDLKFGQELPISGDAGADHRTRANPALPRGEDPVLAACRHRVPAGRRLGGSGWRRGV
jgi:HrpA-like RNA helicase